MAMGGVPVDFDSIGWHCFKNVCFLQSTRRLHNEGPSQSVSISCLDAI